MRWPKQEAGTTADIALLLEGTYPFVAGGVSSWVHEIIRRLPERTFSLFFVGGSPESYGDLRFELPPNVIHLECHYTTTPDVHVKPRLHEGNHRAFEMSAELHTAFRTPGSPLTSLMKQLVELLGHPNGLSREAFFHSRSAWETICEDYESRCTEPSFLDYFWTIRMMHAPLFVLDAVARNAPPARVYHSISTGYAGFLGALLHHRRQRPLLISEHGIYTKERKIDLSHAPWIREDLSIFNGGNGTDVGYLRQLWVRFYEGLGRCAYSAARSIVALYEGNRRRQIADGALEERTSVISNGIDVTRFSALRSKRATGVPPVLGLLGRVVPIKDVRTFIRAMRIICDQLPEAEGWIVGPTAEDEGYGRECEELVHSLGLEGRVKFLGFQKPDDILPKLGVMVLTSISEALPLVILEAWASGVPVIATDVGACRELIEGRSPDDRALGAAGIVTPIAAPEETAAAAVRLLSSEEEWNAAQQAGIARVERYYTQKQMIDAYRNLYHEAISWQG